MSVIENVLKEEAQRLKSNISFYKEQLAKLPRGTIFVRDEYVYRKRKENGVVKCIYLGKINQEHVMKQIELSKDYKRIRDNLKVAKEELIKLEKALKAYE